MRKFTLLTMFIVAVLTMIANSANAAGDAGDDVEIFAVVESTDDVSNIPITLCLTNPSTEICGIEAKFDPPVDVSKFVNTDLYNSTDRWNKNTVVDLSTPTYENNALYCWLRDSEDYGTPLKDTEGPVITVYFDGSELADGSYTVKMYDVIAYTPPYTKIYTLDEANIGFSIRNGKVIGKRIPGYGTVTYIVDGEVYEKQYYKEGAEIVPLDEPVKVGHVFSGWSTIPSVMGTEDITVTGTFTEQLILATDISLNHEELYKRIGSLQRIDATITPNNASQQVLWTSSNEEVATVDESGWVRSIAEGTAIITATTVDGSNKKASCIVYVSETGGVEMDCYVTPTSDISRVPISITLENPSDDIYRVGFPLEFFPVTNGVVGDDPVEGAVKKIIMEDQDKPECTNTERWNGHSISSEYDLHFGNEILYVDIARSGGKFFTGNKGVIATLFFDASEFADGDYVVEMYDCVAVTSGLDQLHLYADANFTIKDGQVYATTYPSISGLIYAVSDDNNTATVIGIEDSQVGNVSIPQTIELDGNSYTVTSIGCK
ncbi:MAG: Ig domain-containing protein [Bacteroidaceae bacterium]|nr:Ig domain-containing protein [Bacteroidaceae bacterium]